MMFMYVFSCQYSQNKNETLSNKKQNILNKMKKTEAEWKRSLTDQEYRILREKGTERAFTGKYDGHFEEGVYECAGCGSNFSNLKQNIDLDVVGLHFMMLSLEQLKNTMIIRLV